MNRSLTLSSSPLSAANQYLYAILWVVPESVCAIIWIFITSRSRPYYLTDCIRRGKSYIRCYSKHQQNIKFLAKGIQYCFRHFEKKTFHCKIVEGIKTKTLSPIFIFNSVYQMW